ncbi:MAG: NAD(P)-dependent oxidoreductase [Cyclobacteriaceae bacterium]
MNILITGANGFLGSFLCRIASADTSNNVVAIVRKNANTERIGKISNLRIAKINYKNIDTVTESLVKIGLNHFDLVIHNAGLTKSTTPEPFHSINVGITQTLLSALIKSKLIDNGKFCYVSSQAALGPVGTNGPVSAYGESKLLAEKAIIDSGLPYMIFRPTGIYGAGDSEFLPLFKSVKSGFYPCAAPVDQKVTLIHAHDVAKNILSLSKRIQNKIVHLSDGSIYSHIDLKNSLAASLNKKALFIVIPQWLTKFFLGMSALLSKLLNIDPMLTLEKHGEISKDWDHDFSSERKEIPLDIKYDLHSGFADTSEYYRSKNLL